MVSSKCSGKGQDSKGVVTLFTSKRGLSDGSNQFEQVSNDPIGVLCLIMSSYHLNGGPSHVHPPGMICGVHFRYFSQIYT